MANAEVASSGELSFGGQIAGRFQGFRFTPDADFRAELATIDDAALADAVALEFEVRANRLSEAVDSALVLANDGVIRWLGDPIAKIVAGDSLLAPRALVLADETLSETAQAKAQTRIDLWLAAYVKRLLGPLFEIEAGVGLEGAARNVARQLVESLGVLERARVAHDVKSLDQSARGALRKLGVRFGAYYIYVPTLVKPAIRVLATQLWGLRNSEASFGSGLHDIPQLAASGRTSFLADGAIPKETYRVAGFRLCGDRAVRVDIVERLADLIRPAIAYRPGVGAGAPPPGSADADGFVVTGAMTSLTGCSGEQFASVLRSLGFVSERIKGPALTVAASMPDPVEPVGEMSGSAPPSTERLSEPLDDASTPVGHSETVEASASPPGAAADDAASQETVGAADEASAPVLPPASESASAPIVDDAPGQPVEELEATLIEVWRPRPVTRRRPPRASARAIGSPTLEAHPVESQAFDGHATSEGIRSRRRGRAPRSPPYAGVHVDSRANRDMEAPGAEPAVAGRPAPPRGSEGGAGRRGGPKRGSAQERAPLERKPDGPSAPVARREQPVDPNSPFAKLLALKLQLEAKSKGN